MLPEVEYLGHIITKDGLKPSDSKLAAVSKAPVPKNVSELMALSTNMGSFCHICQQHYLPSTSYCRKVHVFSGRNSTRKLLTQYGHS